MGGLEGNECHSVIRGVDDLRTYQGQMGYGVSNSIKHKRGQAILFSKLVTDFNLYMDQGWHEEFLVPRSSGSRTFFYSSISRGINSITLRVLESSPKFLEDLENGKISFFLRIKTMLKNKSLQQFYFLGLLSLFLILL